MLILDFSFFIMQQENVQVDWTGNQDRIVAQTIFKILIYYNINFLVIEIRKFDIMKTMISFDKDLECVWYLRIKWVLSAYNYRYLSIIC